MVNQSDSSLDLRLCKCLHPAAIAVDSKLFAFP